MLSLPAKFRRHLGDLQLLRPGCSVLVAVSGGADSVALLHLLVLHASHFGIRVVAGHLDHSLRVESRDDAVFVANLCAGLDVPLVSSRIDVPALVAARRGGVEEVARDARREFLLHSALQHGCELIALGHHADDQAETFLIRLLRGAGPAGLSGMQAVRRPFVRPLLPFTRAELVEWLRVERIPWVEDSSNSDVFFLRNRVRHRLLPELESCNPRIREHLVALSRLMAADEQDWQLRVQRELSHVSTLPDGGCCAPRALLADASPAFAARLARALLAQVRGDLRGISSCHVEALLSLVRGRRSQGECHLPRAWVALRYDMLLVRRSPLEVVAQHEFAISAPGDYPLADGRLLRVRLSGAKGRGGGVLSCVAHAGFPLTVRAPLPGDRLLLERPAGHKKLQDLFVDLKLTREQRAAAIVVADARRLLWVVGIRRAGEADVLPEEECLSLEVLETAVSQAQKP